ncbi:MAG: hypothetical protein NVV63_17185 [Opitutus sp.]|nr:hypothetical protein [Opitutus sp.]
MKTFFLLLAFVLAGCDTSAAINAKSYFDGVQLIFVKAVCAGKFSDADRAIDNGASIDGAGTRGMTPLVFALLDSGSKCDMPRGWDTGN